MRTAAWDTWIDTARSIPIEDEIARRGYKLKRIAAHEYAGPCPVCGGADRFSINTRKRIFNCRGCNRGGDVISMVQLFDGFAFKDAVRTLAGDSPRQQIELRPKATQISDEYGQAQHRKAAWLWNQRQPIAGSIAEKYLREARSITCALPATLGFLPARGDYPPAMIAAYSIPGESEPGVVDVPTAVNSVHITRLLPDGSNRQQGNDAKITIGQPLGRPIVVAPINDLLGLAITEGIEDGLAVAEATGLGVWCSGPASFMPALAASVPAYVEAVTIYSHPDRSGQDNAHNLAAALQFRNVEIRIQGILA
jgi:hypothetical protein